MQVPFDIELLKNQRLLRDQTDFPQICELAGLDSGYLRKKLASYQQ